MTRSEAKLADRLAAILPRLPTAGRCVAVEVGVYRGQLSELLLLARPGLVLHCVDNWLPGDQQPAAYKASNDPHAGLAAADQARYKSEALARLTPFGGRVVVWESGSPAAVHDPLMESGFDLVFLDGRHDREGLEADLAAWWPLVAVGGWLGVHDYGEDAHSRNDRFSFDVKEVFDRWAIFHELLPERDVGTTCWVMRL